MTELDIEILTAAEYYRRLHGITDYEPSPEIRRFQKHVAQNPTAYAATKATPNVRSQWQIPVKRGTLEVVHPASAG